MSPDEFADILAFDGEFLQESFRGWSLAGRSLPAVSFVDCDLTGVDFTGCRFERTTFVQCRLQGARFVDAAMTSVRS